MNANNAPGLAAAGEETLPPPSYMALADFVGVRYIHTTGQLPRSTSGGKMGFLAAPTGETQPNE